MKTSSGSSKRGASRKDVEVLATLLVAYPQVSRATYDPDMKTLGMVFLCRGPLGKAKRESISTLYLDSTEVYGSLIGQERTYASATWEKMDRFHALLVERDVSSLTPGELSLTVDLVADRVNLVLAADSGDGFDDGEEYSWSARLFLQEMLDQVRTLKSTRKLVALREGERVLVYDK
jgi:hypothetical protein